MAMTEKTKKGLKIGGIVAGVLLVLGIIAYYTGMFFKKYSIAWAGGQKVNAIGDGKFYAGLQLTETNGKIGDPDIKVGDYVNVTSTDAPGLAGKHKVIQLGSDDGSAADQIIVIDVVMGAIDATGTLDTRGTGTVKKA